MRKKQNFTRKNGRFIARACALFAAATCLCILFAACGQHDEDSSTVHVASVTLNKTSLTMAIGEEETLIAVIAPSNAANQNIEWTSSAPTIIFVSNGKVTAIAAGSGIITVKTNDGNKTDSCIVVVSNTVATPTATPTGGEVAANTAITLATATTGAAIYYTQNGTEPSTTSALYSDTNKPIITTGKLTLKAIAVKNGLNRSATLTATYSIGGETLVTLGTDYNYFGGQPENQAGWATDNHKEATKKLGLRLEDFQTAKYLVLTLKEGGLNGGISLIWGGYGENKAEESLGLSNPGWMSQQIVSNGGDPDASKGAVLTGNVLKIELSKALNGYDAYTSSVLTELKLLIAYYQGIDNLIGNAYLQTSD